MQNDIQSIQYQWDSSHLGRTMELKVYGKEGKPVLVFPTRGGRFFDFENFGMVDACLPFIESGKIRLYTVDSVDNESWLNESLPPVDRARRHEEYDAYIIHEVLPFIHKDCGYRGKIITMGCDMGGYHAANFFFRHPEFFDAMISLSGFFHLQMFIGDYMDENVYFNSPLHYLPNLDDPRILQLYRKSDICICVGQGQWEESMMAHAYAMKKVLKDKGIPCWVDFWGQDVSHDWIWWRQQLPYFLDQLNL